MKRSKNISRRTAFGMGGALAVSPLLQGQFQQEPAVPEPLMVDLALNHRNRGSEPTSPRTWLDATGIPGEEGSGWSLPIGGLQWSAIARGSEEIRRGTMKNGMCCNFPE